PRHSPLTPFPTRRSSDLNDTQLFVLFGVFCYNPLASRRSRIRAGHGGHSRTGAGPYTHPRLSQGNSSASFHCEVVGPVDRVGGGDRKSTRLNSSHGSISF